MGFQYVPTSYGRLVLWVSHTTVVFGLGSRNRDLSVASSRPAGCGPEMIRRASKRSQICADSPRCGLSLHHVAHHLDTIDLPDFLCCFAHLRLGRRTSIRREPHRLLDQLRTRQRVSRIPFWNFHSRAE